MGWQNDCFMNCSLQTLSQSFVHTNQLSIQHQSHFQNGYFFHFFLIFFTIIYIFFTILAIWLFFFWWGELDTSPNNSNKQLCYINVSVSLSANVQMRTRQLWLFLSCALATIPQGGIKNLSILARFELQTLESAVTCSANWA